MVREGRAGAKPARRPVRVPVQVWRCACPSCLCPSCLAQHLCRSRFGFGACPCLSGCLSRSGPCACPDCLTQHLCLSKLLSMPVQVAGGACPSSSASSPCCACPSCLNPSCLNPAPVPVQVPVAVQVPVEACPGCRWCLSKLPAPCPRACPSSPPVQVHPPCGPRACPGSRVCACPGSRKGARAAPLCPIASRGGLEPCTGSHPLQVRIVLPFRIPPPTGSMADAPRPSVRGLPSMAEGDD